MVKEIALVDGVFSTAITDIGYCDMLIEPWTLLV